MNTEEKAKAYDEALERAKSLSCSSEYEGYKKIFENIFPELVESEDDKIRKEIMDFICWATDRGSITSEQREKSNSWLAWLEKQGEQKPAEWSGEDEDRLDKLVWELKHKKQQSELGLSTGYSPKFWEETIMWLKSLKERCCPQKQWKPTEEQMRVLALSFAGVYREEDIKTLRTLYEDLKEL